MGKTYWIEGWDGSRWDSEILGPSNSGTLSECRQMVRDLYRVNILVDIRIYGERFDGMGRESIEVYRPMRRGASYCAKSIPFARH